MISCTRELFPEPEAPVTQTNIPSGISTLGICKLLWGGGGMGRGGWGAGGGFGGVGIRFSPRRNAPVNDRALANTAGIGWRPVAHNGDNGEFQASRRASADNPTGRSWC